MTGFPKDSTIVAFGPNGDFRVSEIWDSKEQFEKFGSRPMPARRAGITRLGEPEVLEIYNIEKR